MIILVYVYSTEVDLSRDVIYRILICTIYKILQLAIIDLVQFKVLAGNCYIHAHTSGVRGSMFMFNELVIC